MYTEEYEANRFPLRKFLLRFIFVITFICLLIWLIPKFTSPKLNNQDKTELSPIKNPVFKSNLQKLQEVGVDYYTKERLPKEVDTSSKLTLGDMITKKLIVPLVDQENRACDSKKSYVKVTKMEQEYLMKVNLKCQKEEDYILVHLGNYNYCDTAVCPKKETEIKKEKSVPKKEISFGKKKTSQKNSSITDDRAAIIIENKPSETEIKEPEIARPTQVVGYEYEYKKVEGAKYSAWSNWTPWQHTDCNTTAYGCDDHDPNCLKKVQVFKRKEQVGTYNKEYVATRQELKHTNSYEQQACANYNYISFGNRLYIVTTAYSTINSVTSATQRSIEGWKYNGRKSFVTPPSDTLTTRYKYVGGDFSNCSGTCTTPPRKIYDTYTYNGAIGIVSSITASGTVTTNNGQALTVNCAQITKKVIPIYVNVTAYEKAVRKEALYGTVCYASTKTRSLLNGGSSDIRYSKYNDKNLLNQGYYYTGVSRKKG